MAEVHRLNGDHRTALQYYEWAYRIREKVRGIHSLYPVLCVGYTIWLNAYST